MVSVVDAFLSYVNGEGEFNSLAEEAFAEIMRWVNWSAPEEICISMFCTKEGLKRLGFTV